jgi:hypothetical protein
MNKIIPIDFVGGSHGNFLEVTLNKYFNIVEIVDAFTEIGTSHRKSKDYQQNKLFSANHWYRYPKYIQQFDKIISIRFDTDDLLLLSLVSLLRSSDCNINDNDLEIDTRIKLYGQYSYLIDQIDKTYPFLNRNELSIPRNILREFFKFGFRSPEIHGLWAEQKKMQYHPQSKVFVFDYKSFYNIDDFIFKIKNLEKFLDIEFDFSSDLYHYHQKFLNFNPFINHKKVCDNIIESIQSNTNIKISNLSLLQESYINGNLERIYQKEMPFSSVDYFKSTEDMLNYIENQAPSL